MKWRINVSSNLLSKEFPGGFAGKKFLVILLKEFPDGFAGKRFVGDQKGPSFYQRIMRNILSLSNPVGKKRKMMKHFLIQCFGNIAELSLAEILCQRSGRNTTVKENNVMTCIVTVEVNIWIFNEINS